MNKKGELRLLFHKYIDRKEKEAKQPYTSSNPFYGGGTMYNGGSGFRNDFSGTIYFYEWSDIFSEPKRYYTLEGFNNFLKGCGIYLAIWQKDVIKNLSHVYISCRKGSKELIIRQSFLKLKEALEDSDSSSAPPSEPPKKSDEHSIGFEASKPKGDSKEPYNVAITRVPTFTNKAPKIIQQKVFEPEGRWFG